MSGSVRNSFWVSPLPLVLASASAARRALLESAGLEFRVVTPAVDERALEQTLGRLAGGAEVAQRLAEAKALAGSQMTPGAVVVGADQTLTVDSARLSKPASRAAAAEQLRILRGRQHRLNSACAVAIGDAIVFSVVESALLDVRDFSDSFVERYLDRCGDTILSCVGAYRFEGEGIQLFLRVSGDHSVILGLPLLPLLDFFRREGYVLA